MACELEPMSRTYQYRKVMKPMLERKRRARINKCLDELKDLMVGALQNEGDSIAKLEKADVLELTVTHLKKLRQRGQLALKPLPNLQEKYREGYTHCASEVSRCLASIQGVDVTLGTKLMTHLGVKLTEHEKRAPLTILVPQPGPSPTFSTTSSGYSSASELSPAPSSSSSNQESPLPSSQHGLLTFASTQPSVPKPTAAPPKPSVVNSVSSDVAQVSQHQNKLLIISSMETSPISSQITPSNSSPAPYVPSRNSSPVSSQLPSRNLPSDPAKPMWRPW